MKIFTIGFTNKKAERFFEGLRQAGVKRVVDVRLNNMSQLAGFSKKDDLKYFLRTIAGIDYMHSCELAPNRELLEAYRSHGRDWNIYEKEFVELMERRHVEDSAAEYVADQTCLLCSEDKPHRCHRRLVAEYLQRHWEGVLIEHIA